MEFVESIIDSFNEYKRMLPYGMEDNVLLDIRNEEISRRLVIPQKL